MDANDYLNQVKYRLSMYDYGRRPFLENEIILSNIQFAIDFINQYKIETATSQMVDEAIIELAVHRCLVILPTRLPDLKAAWDDIIEKHKSILRMALKGVVPEDVIQQILEEPSKPVSGNQPLRCPVIGRTHSMIYDYYNYKVFKRL